MSRKSEMSPWNVGISAQAQLIQMAVCFLATIHRLHRLQCIFDDLCIFRFDFRDTPTIAQRSPSEEKLQSKLHHLTMIWSQSKNKSWCEITWEREFNKPTDATQFPQTLPASQIPASVPAGTAALRPGHRNSLGFLTLASSRISSTSSHCHQMKENELWVLEKNISPFNSFTHHLPSYDLGRPLSSQLQNFKGQLETIQTAIPTLVEVTWRRRATWIDYDMGSSGFKNLEQPHPCWFVIIFLG